jgi:aldehyde dehydrogenase (NAD+)
VSGLVEGARGEGAEIVAGGTRPSEPGLEDGYYYRPTVVVGARSDSSICQEEVFGPVTAALPFESEEEAVRLANDTRYGLAAGVWSNDVRRCARMRSQLEVGTVWINCYRAFSWQVPFGGMKASGVGRENGLEALREFTQLKSTVTDSGETTPDPFGLDPPESWR